jgi:hypothetical protein
VNLPTVYEDAGQDLNCFARKPNRDALCDTFTGSETKTKELITEPAATRPRTTRSWAAFPALAPRGRLPIAVVSRCSPCSPSSLNLAGAWS